MKLLHLLATCLLLEACGLDDWKELSDGYLHAETDAYNAWIVRGTDAIVDSWIADMEE